MNKGVQDGLDPIAAASMTDLDTAITIRPARPADEPALQRLAALDSAEVPAGSLLLAEADDTLRAALSLADGSLIADPFAPTADVVALLRQRARMARAGRSRRARWRLSLRRATARPA
jgi:hypothetical protein